MKKPLNYENVDALFPLGAILIVSVILSLAYQTYELFKGDVELVERPYYPGEF